MNSYLENAKYRNDAKNAGSMKKRIICNMADYVLNSLHATIRNGNSKITVKLNLKIDLHIEVSFSVLCDPLKNLASTKIPKYAPGAITLIQADANSRPENYRSISYS